MESRHEAKLTGRQHEVVALVAKAISNKEIGRQLNITEGTVKLHLQAIYDKLGIRNRTKLALMALGNPDAFLDRAS